MSAEHSRSAVREAPPRPVALRFDDVAPTNALHPAVVLDPGARVRLLQPDWSDLACGEVELPAGSSLRWSGSSGDHLVYVRLGEMEVGGAQVAPGGVAVVEAAAEVSAVARQDTVLHWFGTDRAPDLADRDGRRDDPPGVHVIGGAGCYARTMDYQSRRLESMFFLDGTCPTCSASLLSVQADGGLTFPPHHHSADEVILMLSGEMQIGARSVGARGALWIAANRRYGLRAPGPFRFLNYRPGVSTITVDPGGPAEPEVAALRGYDQVGEQLVLRGRVHAR